MIKQVISVAIFTAIVGIITFDYASCKRKEIRFNKLIQLRNKSKK